MYLRIRKYIVNSYVGSAAAFLLATSLLLSIVSYHVDDVSWNTSSMLVTNNILGYSGAVLADLLLQIMGLASVALVISIFSWAIILFAKGVITFFWYRCFALMVSTTLLTALFAVLGGEFIPAGPGGYLGATLSIYFYNQSFMIGAVI
jgi:DNA segregation ATPase FtsK/SpoIIIE, S-DNA-T family